MLHVCVMHQVTDYGADTYASTCKCWGEDNAMRSLYCQRFLHAVNAANVAKRTVYHLHLLNGHGSSCSLLMSLFVQLPGGSMQVSL